MNNCLTHKSVHQTPPIIIYEDTQPVMGHIYLTAMELTLKRRSRRVCI